MKELSLVVLIKGGAPQFHLRTFFGDKFVIAIVLDGNILYVLFITGSELVGDGVGVFGEFDMGSVFGYKADSGVLFLFVGKLVGSFWLKAALEEKGHFIIIQ